MNALEKVLSQHPNGVGLTFRQFNLKVPATLTNLASAIVIYGDDFTEQLEKNTAAAWSNAVGEPISLLPTLPATTSVPTMQFTGLVYRPPVSATPAVKWYQNVDWFSTAQTVLKGVLTLKGSKSIDMNYGYPASGTPQQTILGLPMPLAAGLGIAIILVLLFILKR
jgi:hypothetical protein